MVRPNDRFWDYVVKMNNGPVKCKFCEHVFAVATSISRIKSHLSGVKGRGINVCTKVPDDVQEAAYVAVHGANKKRKTFPSSSKPILVSSSWGEQNDEVENVVRDVEGMFMEVQSVDQMENKSGGEMMQRVEMVPSLERHMFDARETRGDALLRTDLVDQTLGKDWCEIYSSLMDDDDDHDFSSNRGNITGELTECVERGSSSEGLHHTRGDSLLKTEPVGQAFEKNMDGVWSLLMKEEVSTIGVYGRGGVGKTMLISHINNLLLERKDAFRHIYWITVTQDFNMSKLQNLIAKTIDFDLPNEDDERKRATKLSKAFLVKQKSVLILDDLWKHFDLEEVGIPVGANGCKLLLTTRSLDVCRWMGCQENLVKVEPLSEEGAWSLFTKELGSYDNKVETLAKCVASECAGLPLGIKTVARSLNGVDDLCVWRNALGKLKESKPRQSEIELEVFWILKYSYTWLNDSALQQCFLYCALFPEDFEIKRNDLIEYLIAERIIQGMRSRQSQFDKGHSMLNKLENACLLEGFTIEDCQYVKMHDLIRDMALQIMKESSTAMVEAGVQLTELPDEDRWPEDVVRVSLMENDIEEISSSLSPRCHNLATLFLCRNYRLELIIDSFFKQLHGLKVLDLSFTAIQELPGSISDLVCLNALLLRGCYKLRYVPSFAKIRTLMMLDFSDAILEEVPHGLESLSNLRYLNLDGTRLKKLPGGLLPNLSCLQFLHLHQSLEGFRTVEVEEVACLRKLESLKCHFYDLVDFNKYLKCLEQRQPLSTFNLIIGRLGGYGFTDFKLSTISRKEISKEVRLYNCNIGTRGDFLALPGGIQKLVIAKCLDVKSLCSIVGTQLKSLVICDCDEIECLLSLSGFCTHLLESLETLHLYWLKSLHDLFSRGAALLPLPYNGNFFCLRTIEVSDCCSIRKLFPSGLLPNLRNLEVIEVEFCEKLEEIIATEEEEEEVYMDVERNSSSSSRSNSINTSTKFSLPKLRILKLRNLSELKSVCRGLLICDSLQEIHIVYCMKLERMPFYLPLPDNGITSIRRIQVYPKAWWESVEWDQPYAKNILQPLCAFQTNTYAMPL